MPEDPMKNVEIEIVDGDKLWIRVDLSKEFGLSKRGKSTIIATSSGPKSIPGKEEYALFLTVYREGGPDVQT